MNKLCYIDQSDYDKKFKDKSGNLWGYYSKKKIKQLYPNAGEKAIKIVAEVSINNKSNDYTLEDGYKSLKLARVGLHKKYLNKVSGYIRCGDDEYVAIIRKNLLMFFYILVAVFSISIGYLYLNNMDNGPNIDKNAIDYVANLEKPENLEDNKIVMPAYGEIYAKEGDTNAYVALWNPEYNTVYFQFEVILDSINQTLLKTDLISPGQAVTSIPLDENMKPGTYDLTIKISSYSLEDYKTSMNGANIKTQLIILED